MLQHIIMPVLQEMLLGGAIYHNIQNPSTASQARYTTTYYLIYLKLRKLIEKCKISGRGGN
jgi:hypothetical protein